MNVPFELLRKEFAMDQNGILDDSNVIEAVLERINKLEYGDKLTIYLFKDMNHYDETN